MSWSCFYGRKLRLLWILVHLPLCDCSFASGASPSGIKQQLSSPVKLFDETLPREKYLKNETQLSIQEMARFKSELSDAKSAAEELALKVAEARVQARAQKKKSDRLKKYAANGGGQQWPHGNNHHQYMKAVRELESAKRELANLKLDRAYVVEEKKMEEEETERLEFRMESKLKLMEELENEIEVANEEHMLVELARIEANRERGELENHRKVEVDFFSRKLKGAKSRVKHLLKEIKKAEDLEAKLGTTDSDIDALQNEMVFVRAMEKNVASSEIVMSKAELDMSREELASLKEEGLELSSWMDVAREEMLLASTEVTLLCKLEEKTEGKVENLNSKLLRAKMKLEAASAADRKSKVILSNLVSTVESLQCGIGEAENEKERMLTETKHLRSETEMNDSDINDMKRKLAAAVEKLETVKASEMRAFERLRILSERAMNHRRVAARDTHVHPPRSTTTTTTTTTITISHREYNYLRDNARGAKEVAEKKVEAANAWVETLKDSEKEALIQTEIVNKEMRELEEKRQKMTAMEEVANEVGVEQQQQYDGAIEVVEKEEKSESVRLQMKAQSSQPFKRDSRKRRWSSPPSEASASTHSSLSVFLKSVSLHQSSQTRQNTRQNT